MKWLERRNPLMPKAADTMPAAISPAFSASRLAAAIAIESFSQPDLNLVVDDAGFVPGHADARILHERARRHVELPPVPRARDNAASEMPFREGAATMEAKTIYRVIGSVDVEERDPSFVHSDRAACAGRDVAHARDSDEVADYYTDKACPPDSRAPRPWRPR